MNAAAVIEVVLLTWMIAATVSAVCVTWCEFRLWQLERRWRRDAAEMRRARLLAATLQDGRSAAIVPIRGARQGARR